MAFLFKGFFWLSLLGGAGAAIGLPTNNAVQSIFNKQEIRKNGWSGEAAKEYEDYWYGNGGFGDSRTKQVNNGQWKTEIESALKDVRKEWGKQNVGKGLEKELGSWLSKKKICQNGNTNNCFIGEIEFIDNKGQTLFGRIPIKDRTELKNVYVKWMKCTTTKKASAVWIGKFRKEGGNTAGQSSDSSQQNNKWKWCTNVENK